MCSYRDLECFVHVADKRDARIDIIQPVSDWKYTTATDP